MITIFCDFSHFFGEKIGVFLKNQCNGQIFAKIAVVLAKNANIFANFFSENILKIITSVPDVAKNRLLGAFFCLWVHFLF
jgi:hypothetical protein